MLESPANLISAFDDFLEASAVGPHNQLDFAARVLAWAPRDELLHPFTHTAEPIGLAPVRDSLQRLFGRRRSQREFTNRTLSARDTAALLAATGVARGRRVLPSAGGLEPVHVYGLARRVAGPLANSIFKYEHATHQASRIGDVPPDDELRYLFQIQEDSLPQLVLSFVIDPRAAIAKYGERGGRFLIQEVGHAAQNVGLRLAKNRLRGYILGAPLDRPLIAAIGLAATPAVVITGYACGR